MVSQSFMRCEAEQATVGKTVNMNVYAKMIIPVRSVETFVHQTNIDGEKNEAKHRNNSLYDVYSNCCNDTCYYDVIGGYNMSFEWHRMHKHEEQIENDVYERVSEQILEHYGVENLAELTEEHWEEIHKWQEENVSEYSPMNSGFSDCYNQWENENE